jgi:ATP-dependent helicase HrpA
LLADERAEGRFDPELEIYRWLLEDYRVAVFAPGSSVGGATNLARLDAQWNRVRLD